VATDYVTGVLRAIVEKKLSSAIGFKGICKKVCIFTLVGVANVLDTNIIGSGCVLRSAVIFFYTSNEGISIIENVARMASRSAEIAGYDASAWRKIILS